MRNHNRPSRARKVVLPIFEVTETSEQSDQAAARVDAMGQIYYTRPKLVMEEGKRRDGKPRWVRHQFNLFPLIVDMRGVPWAEANIWLLSRLEGVLNPDMTTYFALADDLAAYRQFLDDNDLDWLHFPENKLSRPTYRFRGHLRYCIDADEIAASSAKRRIGTVIGFYRWLTSEKAFFPAHVAWLESDQYIQFVGAQGFTQLKKVKVTDLRLNIPQQRDPFDGTIDDGGKLRPLNTDEQLWLLDALGQLQNTEMTLIHLFSLLTGARIQTTLTMRVRHAHYKVADGTRGDVRMPVGPGTGVDTKRNKRLVLHIPMWFYRLLTTYADSDRARNRRERARGGDHENQYLFLSQRGVPFYRSKEDIHNFDGSNKLRHQKVGQGVRQFMRERVIPFIRKKYSVATFRYKFHDTRATAGMNWTDMQLELVERGQTTLHEAREFVRVRMGHDSSAVTDRYLSYRRNLKLVRRIEEGHEAHLKALALRAVTAQQ
jgi:hypothetical protein